MLSSLPFVAWHGRASRLILFGAGLLAHGMHELQEGRVLPMLVEHVWDVNSVLNDRSMEGTFLTALLGCNGNPSLLGAVA